MQECIILFKEKSEGCLCLLLLVHKNHSDLVEKKTIILGIKRKFEQFDSHLTVFLGQRVKFSVNP